MVHDVSTSHFASSHAGSMTEKAKETSSPTRKVDSEQGDHVESSGLRAVHEPPPDGGLRAWLVVVSCFLYSFNLLGITYSYGVYQAHYQLHQFPNDPPELISFVGSICTALTLTVGIPVGRWVEVYGFRTVALGGSIVFSGALVAASFCRTIPTLLVTQGILTGIGAGILFIPANTAPAQWFLKKRSISIGIATAGAGIGGICWSFLSRAIIAHKGYQWSLRITGIISGVINAIALWLLKSRPVPPSARHDSMWSGLVIFKDPKFSTLFIASAISVFGYTIPFFYVPTYAQTQLQTTPLVGSILSAVMDLGIACGRISMGLAADSRLGTMNTVITGMTLAGVSHFVFWLPSAHSLPVLYVFSFLYGFFGGGYIGLLTAVLARIFDPDKLPVITGIFNMSELAGDLAAGPIAGAIFSRTQGQWAPVIVYSGLALTFASVFAWISRFLVNRKVFVSV